jgi:hypothetical protein
MADLNDLFMNTIALFKCNNTCTSIQESHKDDKGMVSKNARGRRGVAKYFTFLGLFHVCVSIFALEDGKHVHK